MELKHHGTPNNETEFRRFLRCSLVGFHIKFRGCINKVGRMSHVNTANPEVSLLHYPTSSFEDGVFSTQQVGHVGTRILISDTLQ